MRVLPEVQCNTVVHSIPSPVSLVLSTGTMPVINHIATGGRILMTKICFTDLKVIPYTNKNSKIQGNNTNMGFYSQKKST